MSELIITTELENVFMGYDFNVLIACQAREM